MQIARPKRDAVVHASNFSRKHVVDALQVFNNYNSLLLRQLYSYTTV